ncbi:MAG: transporter [Limisphaerales bacterium]
MKMLIQSKQPALNPKTEVGRSDRSGDAASPKGECAALGAFFPATVGRRLSNRRRGVAITSCDGGVAATSKPISVFGLNGTETAGLRMALVLAVLLLPRPGLAQDIEPRRWSHLPIGANFAGAAYAYSSGDISLDPVLQIQNGQFDIQTIDVTYIRSFELLGKSARVDLTQPYQFGHWTGLLSGVPATAYRNGLADTSVRFAVNLFGAPPLAGKEYAEYRATNADHETIVGMGLVLQLPTGQYYSDKLINLGDNRFTFRPQLGAVHNWGKWSAELTVQGWFYTDNNDFYNGRRLEQDPVFNVDSHLIYTFRPGLWLSGSVGYDAGGETTINGVSSNNTESNLGWGVGLGLPISRAVGMKFEYIGTRTQVGTGLDSDTFICAISVMF